MKKTVTANVSGTVFHIEEDAYEKLQRYLSGIRGTFTGSHGSDEIMADIEARIAELFSERLQGRQVVTLADVEHVISVMGQPEDFGAADEGATRETASAGTAGPRHRRLFRDPDDHWVGGVMGGIGTYFNFDPLWLRIAFLIVTVAGWGSPLIIYVLLWILVPKAETPADRLSMRGEPVTVDNIKRAFDEGSDRFRAGAERFGDEAKKFGEKWSDPGYRQQQYRGSGAQRVVHGVGSVLGRLLGLGLLLFGALMAFGFIAALFGHSSFTWDADGFTADGIDWNRFAEAWFISPGMVTWAWIGIGLFCLVPITGVLLGGIRLLFDVRVPRMVGWVLTPLWFAGLIILAVIAIRQVNDFRHDERITEDIVLPAPKDRVLHIRSMHDPLFGDEIEEHSGSLDLLDVGTDSIQWGWAELDVKASDDSLFHLEVVRRANGAGVKAAQRRARDIRYAYTIQDSLLAVSPLFTTNTSEKFRCQSVSYILRVPEGASIRFERNAGRIIYDVSNTTGTLDRDMVGRTWTMTPAGLAPGMPGRQKVTEEEEKKNEEGSGRTHITVHVRQQAALDTRPTPHAAPLGLLGLLRSSIRP